MLLMKNGPSADERRRVRLRRGNSLKVIDPIRSKEVTLLGYGRFYKNPRESMCFPGKPTDSYEPPT